MIIVKIKGGLGNQLFCYSFAKALSMKGINVKIDDHSFFQKKIIHEGYQLNYFNISLESANLKEIYKYRGSNSFVKKINLYRNKYIIEKDIRFDKSFLELRGDIYVEGYFQSEMYFKSHRELLLSELKFSCDLSSQKIYNEILNNQYCSVHIRRGDYTNKTNLKIHGVLDLSYYNKAINFLKAKGFKNFIIFSDDIEWCKNHFKINGLNIVFSDFGLNNIQELNLMSRCNSNIIANSTFSWWGAWLNMNNKKFVIAPKKWFSNDTPSDIVPQNWICL